MAVDTGADTVQINENGFAFKKAQDIVNDQIQYVLTHTSLINDFTVGSVARTMLEADAIELEKLYYYTLENLKDAIDDAVTSAFGFVRKRATYAYGNVLITLQSNLLEDLVIDRGTRFYSRKEGYEQVYQTQQAYTVPRGTRSFTIRVYCTVVGSYGNIPADTINATSDLGAILSVTNPESFMTGQDEESPEAEKIRFRQMIQSLARGTNQSLVYAAESVPNIAGGYEFESTYGAVVLFCHDANGDLSPELQQAVADKLVEYRPAGIKVMVMPTHKTMVSMAIGIEVTDSALETMAFLNEVKKVISDYVNGFTVGQDLYKNDLIQKVMDISDYGITNVHLQLRVFPDERMLDYPMIDEDTIINVKGVNVNQPYLHPQDITNKNIYGELNVPQTHLRHKGDMNWKDAINVGQDDEYSIDQAIPVDNVYRTNPNEILRVGLVNVYFATDEEENAQADDTGTYSDNAGDEA